VQTEGSTPWVAKITTHIVKSWLHEELMARFTREVLEHQNVGQIACHHVMYDGRFLTELFAYWKRSEQLTTVLTIGNKPRGGEPMLTQRLHKSLLVCAADKYFQCNDELVDMVLETHLVPSQ
jgi:hypothetical protein